MLVVTLLFFGDTLLDPLHHQLGAAWSEAPGHLWGLWTTAAHLFEAGPFVRTGDVGFPVPFVEHLMDPINLLVFAPVYWLTGAGTASASLAWNALHLATILLASLGAWRLARRALGPDPEAPLAVVAAILAFGGSAALLSYPEAGRTEYLPAALLPWQLLALDDWLRGAGRRRDGLRAGALLGAMALGGQYLAVFSALVEIPVAIAWAAHLGPRRAAARLALVAGVALTIASPGLLALYLHPPTDMDLAAGYLPPDRSRDIVFPLLAHLRLGSSQGHMGLETVAYPGMVTLLLALLGALLRPRAAAPWLLLGLWLWSFAPGPWAEWGGATRHRLPTSAWLLEELLPPLRPISSWSRVACLLGLPMGIAAAHGLAALLRRLQPIRWQVLAAVAVAIIADQSTYPVRAIADGRSFDMRAPTHMAEALATLPPGAILQLPIEQRRRVDREVLDFYQLWQLQHGRPTSSLFSPWYDRAMSFSYLARAAHRIQDSQGRQPEDRLDCARADLRVLREHGFAGVVYHRDRDEDGAIWALVSRVFHGEPSWRGDHLVVWDLAHEDVDPALLPCEVGSGGGMTAPSGLNFLERRAWDEARQRSLHPTPEKPPK